MKSWNKKEKRNYFIAYTLLFSIVMVFVFGIFAYYKKDMIWKEDGLKQHYISLAYFGKWGREIITNIFVRHTFQIPLWDFHLGYGSDILTTLHYYVIGDPLNLLSIFVPQAYTEDLYQALIVIRMYLAGIGFSCYCMEMRKGRMAALAGSLNYVFCSYMMFGLYRHPFFINPMILLPFLLIGAERIFRKEKEVFFSLMVCAAAVSNFYFFYTLVFAVCFYVFVRFYTLEGSHSLRRLCSVVFRFAGYACVGVCMAAFLLLPVILQFLGTSRMDAVQVHPALYPAAWYQKLPFQFLLPDKLGEWTNLGFTAPALFAVFVLFGKRKRHTALKVSFLVMTGMLCIPWFGRALNGFSYVSNRWDYIYAGLISWILVTVWEEFGELKQRDGIITAVFCGIYLLYTVTKANRELKLWVFGIFAFTVLSAYAISCFDRKNGRFRRISAVMFCTVFVHIGINWVILLTGIGNGRIGQFVDAGTAFCRTTTSAPYAVSAFSNEEKEFFRFETDETTMKNTSALAGVNGIQYFWSLENRDISDYLRGMKLNRFRSFNYSNLDCRTFLGALAGVKYFVQRKSDVLPFGYEFKDTVVIGNRGYNIYENQYALPLGYTYNVRIPNKVWQNMDPFERQEALMQGILLEEGAEDIPGLQERVPLSSSQTLDYTVTCDDGAVRLKDGSFDIRKKGAAVRLSFEGKENCETYLYLRGVDSDAESLKRDLMMFEISSDVSHNQMYYHTPYHKHNDGQRDFVIHLGYHKEAQSSVTIKFSGKGSYRFDEMKVVCQPMDEYPKQAAALRECRMENEQIGTNHISGTIDLPKDQVLCLSVPYSRGWRAKVDGKEAALLKANVMYMALPLTAGEHTIELSYRTPGLYAGVGISLAGIVLFVFLWRKRKKCEKTA